MAFVKLVVNKHRKAAQQGLSVSGNTKQKKYKRKEKDMLTINMLGRDFLLTYSVMVGKEDRHISVC